MIWLWILGILFLLAALACRTRIGVLVRFGEAPFSAALTIGPFRVPLTGQKERAPSAKPAGKKAKKTKNRQKKGTVAQLPKMTAADVKEGVRILWPPLQKALRRTRRGIRIDPMHISVTIGAAADPAAGAETYGLACGVMFNLMPALEELVRIPDPGVHLGVDFDNTATKAAGEIGISARLGTLIAAALGVGLPVLRWLSELKDKRQAAPSAGEKAPVHTDAA